MCPKDFYITSLKMKYEKRAKQTKKNRSWQEHDDTAANGFAIVCRPMIGKDKLWKTNVKKVVANGQRWGKW